MSEAEIRLAAERVFRLCRDRGLILTTAESCTGGMVAAAITDIPGSSSIFGCGLVTYSNNAKRELLCVNEALLATHGAVSAEVAKAMAEGALAAAKADIAISLTGIAGPDGGSETKPVGLVFIGCASQNYGYHARECRFGNLGREAVRCKSVIAAFEVIEELLARPSPV